MAETENTEGDLKIWYIPQVPMHAFERTIKHVDGFEEKELALAKLLMDAIIGLSIFEYENKIKPDYSDAAGISRWESDGEDGFDWFDLDESEWRDD